MNQPNTQHTSSNPQSQAKSSLNIPMQATILVTALILAFSLVLGSWLLSNRTTVIRNLGTETTQDGQIVNTITVSGQGSVSAKPDMVNMSVTFEETRDSSSEALEAVNQKVNELNDILSNQGVESKDITTTSFSLLPEYDFSSENGRILLGQQARQTVSFSVKGVDEEGEKAAEIIDAVSEIRDAQFGPINFDVENKEEIYSQARNQAINQAKNRAQEIAETAEVELGSVVNIRDIQTEDITPQSFNSDISAIGSRSGGGGETSISTGELEINLNISVIYEINPR